MSDENEEVKIEYTYVNGRVTKGQKAKLRAKFPGTRLLNSRFAPKDAKIVTADGEPYKAPKAK